MRAALNKLRSATESLLHRDFDELLCISTTESFATHWLIPRLPGLFALHPNFDVRITTQNPVDEFGNDSEELNPPWIDVVIRYGRGNWLGLRSMKLFGEEIVPVCAPELLNGPHPLRNRMTFAITCCCTMTCRCSGVRGCRRLVTRTSMPTRGPRFSHSHMVITAAVRGLGVALGRSALVATGNRRRTPGKTVRA